MPNPDTQLLLQIPQRGRFAGVGSGIYQGIGTDKLLLSSGTPSKTRSRAEMAGWWAFRSQNYVENELLKEQRSSLHQWKCWVDVRMK